MPKYHIGTSGVSARDHAICDGPNVVAVVLGAGYPTGKGWSPESAALTERIVALLNAAEPDGDLAGILEWADPWALPGDQDGMEGQRNRLRGLVLRDAAATK